MSKETAAALTAKLAEVGADFGLQVSGYGHAGNSTVKRLGGQMLQIFIRKIPGFHAEKALFWRTLPLQVLFRACLWCERCYDLKQSLVIAEAACG